ncbi:MerR family transcriptional regulator [Nocardia cyriacigeorgica]|uniref:MerR family transcriptional regulator n=1 Tax=Nocardia cyriacigeorgica TaxID=135487 RepID=UPI0024904A12|nr:MerR family transcriptional regulator [Nocardia cyriacigeorgica]BDT86755.1 MerR family transcriptional regulator [Nocardia cyriacigeorgica]
METLHSPLRTVDVARRAGYSVQQVRNLEHHGVLPPAHRTAAGYRTYGEVHVRSALAYRALAAAVGPVEAKRILRAVHSEPLADALALLDDAHAGLARERTDLRLARAAAAAISAEPIADVRDSDAMSVSELADALGVRPSTLRHWEAEGLLAPDRVTQRARRYSPAQVRDARIIHQLRSAGYRIDTLRTLVPDLPRAHHDDTIATALTARESSITARSRALLEAAAALAAVLPQSNNQLDAADSTAMVERK